MEDISRELEREIARIKPAPYKMRKKNRILIINDLGETRSGAFLNVIVYFFLVISMAGGFCTIAFYLLYSKADNQNLQLKRSQEVLEKKVDRLTREKELLMARLVVTGNTVELETLIRAGKFAQTSPSKEKRSGMKEKKDSVDPLSADATSDLKNADDEPVGLAEQLPDALPSVSVGSFSLSPGRKPKDIVIRFNIRNTTQNSIEISGRIFCVLKPKGAAPDRWVVIPNASIMEDDIPGPYKQGHYFSISRFKPVQFTVNTPIPMQDFATASVFIFDETEKLLFKTTFETGKNKQD